MLPGPDLGVTVGAGRSAAAEARQAELDAAPKVQAIKASRFWERRRPVHLLTSLVQCGHCGGGFIAAGRDYLACANARKFDRCDQRKAIRRPVLEDFVLDLIRDRMMQPNAVKAFVAAYTQEINAGRDGVEAERRLQQRELAAVTTKLDGLYDAIADGLRSPGLQAKLEGMEAEKLKLEGSLAGPPPSPVRLHPNLADLCREKVATLRESLADPSIQDEALAILRGLIERVVAKCGPQGWEIEVQGELVALVALGLANDKAPQPGLQAEALCSAKVVAGARYQRCLQELIQVHA